MKKEGIEKYTKDLTAFIETELSHKRLAEHIFSELTRCKQFTKPKKDSSKVFIPFLIEVDVSTEELTITMHKCLSDGRIGSDWIRKQMEDRLFK